MICKNCGNEFEGNFCNQCGQKKIEGRFTIKEILHNFFHNFTHLDRGFLYLAKELYVKPGIISKEYIDGKRKKYFNPFQYLILVVALSMFLTLNFNLLGPREYVSLFDSSDETVRFYAHMRAFFYKNFNIILFLTVPVSAFFSLIFFRKSGFNYSENLVFNSYIAAQRTLTFILISPFLYFFNKIWYVFIGFYYLFWLVYFIYAFRQFFGEKLSVTIIKFVIMYIILIVSVQGFAQAFVYYFYFK